MNRKLRRQTKVNPERAWLFYGFLLLLAVEYLGIAREVPLLTAIRFSTVLAYGLFLSTLATADIPWLIRAREMKLWLAFVLFTAMSVMWAIVQTHALNTIKDFVGGTVLFVLAAVLVNSRKRLEQLCVLCLAIAFVMVVRNLQAFGDASRTIYYQAGIFLKDGNDFAWGLVVLLPLISYLAVAPRSLTMKLVAWAGIGACLFGIIGTNSRGGSLGLFAACFYFWLFESRKKALTAMILVAGLFGAVLLAPQSYVTRMSTIAEHSDSSSQGRLQAWGSAIRMSVDYPLGVGAGNFSSAYGRFYVPDPEHNRMTVASARWIAAHSIYFRTLGEYGFLGLAMLLSLIIGCIRKNYRLRDHLKPVGTDAERSSLWPSMLNMSLVGFAVCGAFLSGLTYPHIFLLTGLTVATGRIFSSDVKPTVTGGAKRRPSGRRPSLATRG